MPALVLPTRPLLLARNVISTPRAYLWATPIILALAVFLVVWEAPGVVRDVRISRHPLVIETADVQDGTCRTQRAIFTTCEAHLAYRYHKQAYEADVEIMFLDVHAGDYETGVVISTEHPELATMTLGLDKLWNRIVTLASFLALLGGMSVAMLVLGLRIWRVGRQLRQPATLRPVPVEITAFDRRRGVLSVTYTDKVADDRTGRSAHTRMRHGQEPLIVGEAEGKAIGLAVRSGRAALPILLDSRLDRIDLTDEEREAALQPFADGPDRDHPRIGLVEAPRRTVSLWRRLQVFLGLLLLVVIGVAGFWLWYVTSSGTPFQSPGMDINNLMPAPLNEWGCEQLKRRFGQGPAPFGCVAADHASWN